MKLEPLPGKSGKQASWHIRTVPDNALWRPMLHFALAGTAVGVVAWMVHTGTTHAFLEKDAPTVLGFLQLLLCMFFGALVAAVAGFLPFAMVSLYFARRKQSLARCAWIPGLTVAALYLAVMLVCYATHESVHPDRHIGLVIRNIVIQLAYPIALLAGTWSLHRAFLRSQAPPESPKLYRICAPGLVLKPYTCFALVQTAILLLDCVPPLISYHGRAQVMPLAMLAYCLLYSSVIYMPLAWYCLNRAQRLRSIAWAIWPPSLGAFAVYALIILDDYRHAARSTAEAAAPMCFNPDYIGFCGGFDITLIAPMLALIPATFLLQRHLSNHSKPVE